MFKAGHDSEFALIANNRVVSALDAFDEEVFKSPSGSYFADNMNCEIAINPVTDLKDFHEYTEDLLGQVRGKGYQLLMRPVIEYPDSALKHKLAYISGCDPDMNAYTFMENKAPDFAKMKPIRSAGAHFHIEHGIEVDPANLARWLDIYVGVPMILREVPNDRRKMYGSAGCYREKPYGTEYRSLSNVWLDDYDLRSFLWNMGQEALDKAKNYISFEYDPNSTARQIIDSGNTKMAGMFIDEMHDLGVRAA